MDIREEMKLQGIIGIRDQDVKEQLCWRKERTFNKTFRQTAELEMMKQIVGTSIGR
jgi:hypothetical protein